MVNRDLVPAFVKLLKDTEAEVRSAVAGQIPGTSIRCTRTMLLVMLLGFCSLLDRETLLQEVMPSIEELVTDSSQHVRAALGTQISGLAPILGKEKYVM